MQKLKIKMQNDNAKLKILNSFINSAIWTVVFITAATIAAELLPALKEWLAATFSHHWVGKSVLATGVFLGLAGLGFIFPAESKEKIAGRAFILFWVSVLATLVIFGLFIYELVSKPVHIT